MRIVDIIQLCRQSLSRQKARTRLTVLGVTIGCCAIVLMLSLGIGSNEQSQVMLSKLGDLSVINVWAYNAQDKGNPLTKERLDEIKAFDNVELVCPKTRLDAYCNLVAGPNDRYKTDMSINGMSVDSLQKLGYEIKEGDYWKEGETGFGYGKRAIPIIVGEQFFYNFKDTKRPEGRNRRNYEDPNKYVDYTYEAYAEENKAEQEEKPFEEPFFDDINTRMFMCISSYSSGEEEPQVYRQELRIVGVLKGDISKDYNTVSGVYMTNQDVESIAKMLEKKNPDKNKEKKEKGYTEVIVKAKEIKNVKDIETKIKDMGYEPSSMESIRESIEKSTRQQQMMLAGLGSISLFVAAIGIMNTMIMSITERTKEIGIMKALGCYVQDIRKIFLVEAGTIGFIGGVVGIIISLFISFCLNVAGILGLVNKSAAGMDGYVPNSENTMSFFDKLSNINIDFKAIFEGLTTPGNRISIIPIWLIIFGLIFSTLVGLISGYHPANKAVKIPAIEAIKHE